MGQAGEGLQAACTNWHAYVAPGAVTNGPLHFPVSFRATWENSSLLPWMLKRAELSVCSPALVFIEFSAKFQAPFDCFLINTSAQLLWESSFLVHSRILLSGISQDKNAVLGESHVCINLKPQTALAGQVLCWPS